MALMPFRRSNSSIPSSSSSQFRYNVFLSFRGTDTRHNFISHLYKELIREGIETFKDDGELERGKEISPDLLEAIEKSRYSIVVISKNYGSSKWCLDELVKILECQNPKEPTVYPVFFLVNPSEVGKQTGTFGEGFAQLVSKHEMEIERVQIWKEALKKVAKVSGFVYPDPQFESESKLIEEIVGKIIPCENTTSVDEGLVGMNSRIKKAIEWLDLGNDDGCVVGIWGMGGIGKTTLARAVYDRISCQFDGKCFLENVRAVSKERGVMYLQEQLLHEISKGKVHKVNNIKSGQNVIERIVGGKKVLIVLDDVDESIGVEDLLGKHDWFNSGSKIIITGRDWHVLRRNGAILAYKVTELKEDEAVKLFRSKAFSKDEQTGGYEDNIVRAVEYCRGLPLALKVLGSALHDREEIYWECTLKRLEKMPLSEVEEVLEISYNDLVEEDREIFLHIAFFFQRKFKDAVTKILESLDFQPILGIQHLVEKSLVTISRFGELIMHDLIQDFGRNIVRQESPKEPGQRSRLWLFDDIKCVLMNDMGTEKVEGIVMEHPNRGIRAPKDFGSPKELKLGAKAFQKLRKLKILIIRDVHLFEDLEYLPNELRYLEWDGYPSRCMPSKFQPMHLVELHMTQSNIEQLWTETQVLPNLRVLDLADLNYLTMSPDFKTVPNLEELIFNYCTSLVNLHPSIGSLRRLYVLRLYECENLESIPNSIGQLKFLEELDLCWCSKLENLPCSIGGLSLLRILLLQGCGFESLPTTMYQLSKLENLNLSHCKRLQELPEPSLNMVSVEADHCESFRTIASPSIYKSFATFSFLFCFKLVENKGSVLGTGRVVKQPLWSSHHNELFSKIYFFYIFLQQVLPNLKILDLRYSKDLTMIPDFETFPNLEELMLNDCPGLVNLHPSIGSLRRLHVLNLHRCKNLESIPNGIGQLEFLLGLGWLSKPENLPGSDLDLQYLHTLSLRGCAFESLPTSMNQLSMVECIDFSYCKRLQELPELSLNILCVYADHCESLRTIASPSIYKSFAAFSFLNCFKLVENKESNMLTDKFLSNKFQGSQVRKRYGFEINFPGSEIPKWFKHQSNGSSISLQLPPNWFNSKLLGIAIVTVGVGISYDLYSGWNQGSFYNYRIHKGRKTLLISQKSLHHRTLGRKSENMGVRYFTTEEIQRFSQFEVDDELNGNGVKFESEEIGIKKCGIRLVYKEDVEGNDQASGSSPQYEDVNAPLETRPGSLLHLIREEEDEADVDVDVDVDACEAQNRTPDLSIQSSSQVDNLVIVSQVVEDANNVPLKRRSSGSGDFQNEDCPNVKRPRLDQEFNTRRVTPPPNKVGARKKMKLMWMSRWHKRVMWIRSNQSHRGMAV